MQLEWTHVYHLSPSGSSHCALRSPNTLWTTLAFLPITFPTPFLNRLAHIEFDISECQVRRTDNKVNFNPSVIFFVPFSFFLLESEVDCQSPQIAASEELSFSYFPRHVAWTWLRLDLTCESRDFYKVYLLAMWVVVIWYGINTGCCWSLDSVREAIQGAS